MNFKKIYKKLQKKLKKIEAEKKEKYRTKRIKMWTTLYICIFEKGKLEDKEKTNTNDDKDKKTN